MFYLPMRALLVGFGISRRAGFCHRNFSRAPGHAPAGGGCLEENVKLKMARIDFLNARARHSVRAALRQSKTARTE